MHPSYVENGADAYDGGKVKVWCKACFRKRVTDEEASDVRSGRPARERRQIELEREYSIHVLCVRICVLTCHSMVSPAGHGSLPALDAVGILWDGCTSQPVYSDIARYPAACSGGTPESQQVSSERSQRCQAYPRTRRNPHAAVWYRIPCPGTWSGFRLFIHTISCAAFDSAQPSLCQHFCQSHQHPSYLLPCAFSRCPFIYTSNSGAHAFAFAQCQPSLLQPKCR